MKGGLIMWTKGVLQGLLLVQYISNVSCYRNMHTYVLEDILPLLIPTVLVTQFSISIEL